MYSRTTVPEESVVCLTVKLAFTAALEGAPPAEAARATGVTVLTVAPDGVGMGLPPSAACAGAAALSHAPAMSAAGHTARRKRMNMRRLLQSKDGTMLAAAERIDDARKLAYKHSLRY
jgi:hypothetical protein